MKTDNLQEALWDVVRWVAEMQVAPAKELEGLDCWTYCSFCDAFVSQDAQGKYPHEPNCKVTKARELLKQRESRVKVKPMVCARCGKRYEPTDSGWCGKSSVTFCSLDHMEQWEKTTTKDAFALGDEVKLWDLRPGAIFVTRDGCYAVKSEYLYPNGVCECVLLASGEYAHFEQGNRTLVREVRLAE
jgi:hypothetical protein